jgi:hypothetical protein
MEITDSNLEALRLIPYEFREHRLGRLADEEGWDTNHINNGIELPSNHAYAGHKEYNEYVADLLEQFFSEQMDSI